MPKIDPAYIIADEDSLRALYPATHDLAKIKVLDHLDPHARAFVARSPFLCLGTQTPDGQADVSPRGDPACFVKVIDDRTFMIPDRPGNNRLDSLSNIVRNPSVGVLFLIPGFDETLRVNGCAVVSTDPALLSQMTVQDRTPTAAIVVDVQEVFLHCAKALRRSRLWQQDGHVDRGEMPSLMKMILDQTTGAPDDMEELDAGLEEAYRTSMY